MTVEAAEKMWSKNNLSVRSPDARRKKVRITEGYTVVAETTDKIKDVLDAEDLPQIGDLYPESQQIRVTEQNPQQLSPIYYMVMVTYEGEIDDTITSNPIDVNPTIRWRNIISEVEWDRAFDDAGNVVPLATANHEPVRGITERIVDWVALVERNYAFGSVTADLIHQYFHAVNSDLIQTNIGNFAPGIARLTKFEPEEQFDGSIGGYFKVNAEVTFRYPYGPLLDGDPNPQGRAWWARYLHEGYVMRVRADGAPDDGSEDRLINAIEGNRDTSLRPLLLDEDGFPIADPTDAATPAHYRSQRTLLELPYAALGLF